MTVFCFFACLGQTAGAATASRGIFARANALYQEGRFTDALELYEDLAQKGETSGALYFNIGNCYYKTANLGKAILNYERAAKWIPRDPDLKLNLGVARAKIAGYPVKPKEPFDGLGLLRANGEPVEPALFLWRLSGFFFKDMTIAENTWFLSGLYFLLIAGLMGIILLPSHRKRLSFGLLFIALIFILATASLCYKIGPQSRNAIIVAEKISARFEPLKDATVHFELYEGAKARVLETQNAWSKIKREDGKIGWVPSETIQSILLSPQ